MITQRVKLDVNNQQGPTIYARMGEKNLRQIVFILTRKDEESGEDVAVDIPSGAVGQLRILKPSNNFVIVDMVKTTLESGSTIFTATLPEQAVTVGGLCYYDVRIEENTSKFVFSATGHMVVDDAVISSGVLEDVSEVNGLVFPDDFLTDYDDIARIDDSIISSYSVWSSFKTNQEISSIDLSDYATKTYVDNAIEQAGGKVVYSSTPQETGEYNGKKVYTVVLSNFTVRSFSGTEYNSRINNMPVASKILSLRILCNYMGYSSVSFPADCFYDNLNNAIQIRGFISPSFSSVTLDAAIVEYVEV